MQRHMQSISFLVIVGVLLGCAFLFSQQTRLSSNKPDPSQTPTNIEKSIVEIPNCNGVKSDIDIQTCYNQANSISNTLIGAMADKIYALEADTEQRIAFMDLQLAWEKSRDADCAFIRERISDPEEASLKETICLFEQNLTRLNQLEGYLCEWYDSSACPEILNVD